MTEGLAANQNHILRIFGWLILRNGLPHRKNPYICGQRYVPKSVLKCQESGENMQKWHKYAQKGRF